MFFKDFYDFYIAVIIVVVDRNLDHAHTNNLVRTLLIALQGILKPYVDFSSSDLSSGLEIWNWIL